MANCLPPAIVRIRGFNGEAKDWRVPNEVNFRMVLVSLSTPPSPPTLCIGITAVCVFAQDVLSQALPGLNPLPTAFECECGLMLP